MNYITSMSNDEVRALIESGVPCYKKYGHWNVGTWNPRIGAPNQMPAPKPMEKEKALEILPGHRVGGMWDIRIPTDKSFIVFIEPSLSDLD